MVEPTEWSLSKLLDTLIVFLQELSEGISFEKSQQMTTKVLIMPGTLKHRIRDSSAQRNPINKDIL